MNRITVGLHSPRTWRFHCSDGLIYIKDGRGGVMLKTGGRPGVTRVRALDPLELDIKDGGACDAA